jgi:sigma-B regulation protein RsbU (phosphoserine phosphatase)
VTAFVGFYDPARQLVRFANAGHSPVIYRPVREAPRMLPATSLPLGVFEDLTATDDCVRMASGDVLVVGTDGFSEATNPTGAIFGYERLLSLVHELAGQSAEAIVDGLFAAIAEFGQGAAQDDDQTLLVVKGS